ncbi:MAG: anion permease, partial [Nitrospinae bacterium]|nr:anion permease [Nitrospinota bacterium]
AGICAMVATLTQGAGARFNTGLLLAIAYAALIGGIGTPIGTPPNLIGIGMLDKLANFKIPFYVWMQLAVPIMLVMLALMIALLYALHRPPALEIAGLSKFIAGRKGELGVWTRGQKNTLIAFSLAILLWVLPGIVAALAGSNSEFYKLLDAHLHEESVSLIAAILLFLMPVDWAKREFTLTWKDAVQIDWGTILLFGGGLALGGLIFSTGLADVMGNAIIETTGVQSVWGITAIATGLAIIITEFTSNTATANMLAPLIISVASTAGISPVPPVIGVCLGASMAFMLPVSTPSNAIVYGSGRVPIAAMIRAGILLDVTGFFVINAGLRLLCPLLGLA